jgi:hypothetical protein
VMMARLRLDKIQRSFGDKRVPPTRILLLRPFLDATESLGCMRLARARSQDRKDDAPTSDEGHTLLESVWLELDPH